MVIIRLTNIVILIAVYSTKNINASDAVPSSSNTSFAELKSSSQNGSGIFGNGSNFTFTVESSITSSNLKIRNEITLNEFNKDVHSSTREGLECENYVQPRSITDEYLNVLNAYNLTAKLQAIEKALKDIQDQNKKCSTSCSSTDNNVDLIKRKNLGVHCTTCTETVESQTEYPKNCKEILRSGKNVTGIYKIHPKNSKKPFSVLCDMDIRGGGWTHIQKRFDGSEDFNRNWRDYKFGFGDLEGEFWLGLQNIHDLTGYDPVELLVEVTLRNGASGYAHYSSFGIGPETTAYKLERLSGFSGDAGDSLTHHFGQRFSTRDLDFTKSNCATGHRGGWWFVNCLWSNLNGNVINIDLPLEKFYYVGLYWYTYKDENCLAGSRMLVRPVN